MFRQGYRKTSIAEIGTTDDTYVRVGQPWSAKNTKISVVDKNQGGIIGGSDVTYISSTCSRHPSECLSSIRGIFCLFAQWPLQFFDPHPLVSAAKAVATCRTPRSSSAHARGLDGCSRTCAGSSGTSRRGHHMLLRESVLSRSLWGTRRSHPSR